MSQLSDKVKEAVQKLFDHAPNILQDDEIKLLRYHQLIAQEEEKSPVTCPDYVETALEFNNNRLRTILIDSGLWK
jgi:hypothetical protein